MNKQRVFNAIIAAGILGSSFPAYQVYAEETETAEESVLVIKEGETKEIVFTEADDIYDVTVSEDAKDYIAAVYDGETYTVSVTGLSACEEAVLIVMKNPDADSEETIVKVKVEPASEEAAEEDQTAEPAEEQEAAETVPASENTDTEAIEMTDETAEEEYKAGEMAVIKVSSSLKGTLTINGETVAPGSTYDKAEQNSKVTIVYQPSEMEKFVKWILTGNASVDDAAKTTAVVTLGTEDLEIGAEIQQYYAVNVVSTNGGNASASAEKAVKGTKVTVTASEVSGLKFNGFTASGITLTAEQKKAQKITLTMPEKDVTITANYVKIEDNKFITANGKSYYYRNGKPLTGIKTINGKQYFFDSNGVLQKGSQLVTNSSGVKKRFYFNQSSDPAKCYKFIGTGWKKLGGKWYYLKSDSSLTTDWVQVKGKWYFLGTDGAMLTGWQKIRGHHFYLDPSSGEMAVGWKKVKGYWYYMNASGVMQTGWQKIKGVWYYLKDNGVMVTGWKKLSGKWYFLKSNGAMATGWLKDGGKWYYMNSSGSMKSDTWFTDKGYKYYLSASGAMVTGWLKRPDAWYWFRDSGTMYSNGTINIDGKNQRFAITGQWIDNSWIASNARPFRLYVNRAHCTMTVYLKDYQGNFVIPYKAILISVGLSGTSTPSGWSEIGQKYYWYWYKEDTCWLRYVSFFSNGVKMMHSEAYMSQNLDDMLLGEFNKLGSPASHGCVRMALIDAKWVYENCYGGTKVYVYDDWSSPGPLGKPSAIRVDDSSGTGWDPTDPDPDNPWNW